MNTTFLRFAIFAVLTASAAFAQTGAIQGVVTDSSDAAVPTATVTVTNLDTGLRREARTNETGFFSLPSLPVGRYKVVASHTGFADSERPDLKLDVSQVARLDFQLKTGSLTETVNVSATAALLDSETSTVGQVIDNKRIVEMPLNGRNYLQLAALTAGVAPSVGGRTSDEGGFVASGQHGYQVNIMVDGLDNSSVSSGGPLGFEAQAVKPSIDAVDEFRVVTNNLSAEYGYRMGGHVMVNVKSGTNQVHGSAYEFLRNSSLDGTNFFANRNGARKPAFKQNQYGGTLGGPLVKNRTFLFGSFEGTKVRLGRSFVSTVPTLDLLEGNFNRIRPVFDPASTTGTGAAMRRTAFPGNTVPRSRWDPLVPKLLTLYPRPTDTTRIANNYFFSPNEKNDQNTYDFKGDHNLSDTSRVSARYSRRDKDRFEPGPLPLPGDGGLGTITDILAHSFVANWSKTFGGSFTNDFRFGFTKLITRFDIPFDKPLFEEFGIKGIPRTGRGTSNDHGLTRFSPAGYAEIGSRSFWPNFNNLNLYQFSNTAFKSIGKHGVKFGGELKRENIFRNAARFARGQMGFSREFSADPQNRAATGDGFAEFLLGWPAGGTVGNENGEDLYAKALSLFVQDDWKVTNNLTLNLGVRYDIFFMPTFPNGAVSNFALDYSNLGASARLPQSRPASKGDCGCRQDLNNIAPRLGFAWRVTPKTVVRAGAGIVYARADSQSTQAARWANQPPDFAEVVLATLDRINPRFFLKDGFPTVQLPATTVPGPALVGINARERFLPTQYSAQWFMDLQRELPFDTLFTLGYSGNGTRKLAGSLDYNLPYGPGPTPVPQRRQWPYYTSVTNDSVPFGNLSYHALQWKLEKRFSRGLQFLSAYTWSHTIDNVVENLNQSGGQGALVPWNRSLERANSVADIRHQYVVSSTYELPFGKGKLWMNQNRAADLILGGWQIGGIFSARGGLPFTVNTTGGLTNAGGADRPNRLGNGTLSSGRTVDRWFDVAAFQVQPAFTYGNAGRNILRGPGQVNLDFSLAKRFALTERHALQLRFESFNFTNTPAFGLPAATINAPRAGEITSAGEPRRIQFGLKFLF